MTFLRISNKFLYYAYCANYYSLQKDLLGYFLPSFANLMMFYCTGKQLNLLGLLKKRFLNYDWYFVTIFCSHLEMLLQTNSTELFACICSRARCHDDVLPGCSPRLSNEATFGH